ncbi:MAG: hypothetical protein CMM18_01160 [Rhodospirillaceae bacterium]|nr:hypothetical protein [Rhodospirillaceae bacterium]
MTFIRLLVLFAIVISFMWFSAVNFTNININLYPFPWRINLPLYLVVIICIFFGFFTGIIFGMTNKGKKRKK